MLFTNAGQTTEATTGTKIAIVNYGSLANLAQAAADALANQGHTVEILDPTWVVPVEAELLERLADADLIITVEDNGIHGGAGSRLSIELNAKGSTAVIRHIGIPQEFLAHASRGEVLESLGLTPTVVAEQACNWVSQLQR